MNFEASLLRATCYTIKILHLKWLPSTSEQIFSGSIMDSYSFLYNQEPSTNEQANPLERNFQFFGGAIRRRNTERSTSILTPVAKTANKARRRV